MKTVQVRLTEEQLRKIDEQVEAGIYPNRSEAIRDHLRKAEFVELFRQFFTLTSQHTFTEEELDQVREKIWHEKYAPKLKQERAAKAEG
jgi:Arc/MetJ-type ribon-helix-helix transcriptional regulator